MQAPVLTVSRFHSPAERQLFHSSGLWRLLPATLRVPAMGETPAEAIAPPWLRPDGRRPIQANWLSPSGPRSAAARCQLERRRSRLLRIRTLPVVIASRNTEL